MNMFWELLEAVIKCMIVFQELNFDPVKEILKMRCHSHLYFNEESDYFEENTCENGSLSLCHRKKPNIFTPSCWFITHSIRIENLDWCKCQKPPLEVLCEKRCSLKCRKIHSKLLCRGKHLWFYKIFKNTFFAEQLRMTASEMRTL